MKDCFLATAEVLDSKGVHVLNYAFDGESLHLATTLDDGSPGTELALAKQISKKLKSFPKSELVKLVAENDNIDLEADNDDIEIDAEDELPIEAEELINESVVFTDLEVNVDTFSLEDLESMLTVRKTSDEEIIKLRLVKCKGMRIMELRNLCLKELFPRIKKKWLIEVYGSDQIIVLIDDKQISYNPTTVFEKDRYGHFRTVTFDPAHLSNLIREHSAKGKLAN